MTTAIQNLQVRHYRLIHAITATGQLSLAAERLAITQPAASRNLSEIEDIVGHALFDRHPKGMTPTPIGEVLARHAGVVLDDLDEANREVEAFRAGKSGSVRIGAVTSGGVSMVVPAVQSLGEDLKHTEVHIDIGSSIDLVSRLMRGEYDFAVCRIPPGFDARDFDVRPGRVELVEFLVRSGHPLAGADRRPLSDLAGFPWVVQGRGTPMREAVEGAFEGAGVPPPSEIINTTSLLVMIAYLQSSDAISPVSQELADLVRSTNAGGMETVILTQSIIIAPFLVIRRINRPLSPMARRLFDLVSGDMRA